MKIKVKYLLFLVFGFIILATEVPFIPGNFLVKGKVNQTHDPITTQVRIENMGKLIKRNSQTKDAEDALNWFVDRLKTFIGVLYFNIDSFEENMNILQQDIQFIGNVVEHLDPCCIEIIKQLFFARRMFEYMIFAAKELRRFDYFVFQYQHLVYLILELNVKLFSLHDAYGFLDRQIPRYKYLVIDSWKNMCIWSEDFKAIENVPSDVRRLFEHQKAIAEETIEELWSQFPDE